MGVLYGKIQVAWESQSRFLRYNFWVAIVLIYENRIDQEESRDFKKSI